jgi:hypothetical protein
VRPRLHRPPGCYRLLVPSERRFRGPSPMMRPCSKLAWRAFKPEHITEVRLLIAENSLHLEERWVSEILLEEVEDREDVETLGEPISLEFDSGGHLVL